LKHYRHEFEYMIDHGGKSIVGQTGAESPAPQVQYG
jgi:hypothetical protein